MRQPGTVPSSSNASRNVAGYYRVSQARDGMKAPEIYEDEISRYCAYRKLELGEIFSDLDYSGYRNSEKRPALNELVRRRHEFSGVVVPKLSRFGRSLKHLTQLFDTFDSDGIPLTFLDLGLDTTISEGRLLRNVMASFAEYESDVRSDYARANHRRVRAEGRPWGGRPPFGYERHASQRTYLVHPERAVIVEAIFRSYLAGQSQYRIAAELNHSGGRRPSGAPWSTQQIGRVLDNPAYAALCLVDEDEIVPGKWEPIVDQDTWDAVRRVRSRQAVRVKQLRTRKRGPYLLSGLIFCGSCGGRLHHRSKPKTSNGVYGCRLQGRGRCSGGSIDTRLADDFVAQRFMDRYEVVVDGETPVANISIERRWERATIEQRRTLLWPAIAKVVLEPWPEGVDPRRAGGRRRSLTIEWTNEPRADQKTEILVTRSGPEPPPSADARPISEGRADMWRGAEVAALERGAAARSARSRAARASWQRVREERLIDAGIPAAVGPTPAAVGPPPAAAT